MKYFFLALYLMIRFYSALSSLPAPVNVSVDSVNFHHVLRWEPGPGTPPGVQYLIYRRVNKKKEPLKPSNTTWRRLRLKTDVMYHLSVQALLNLSRSPESSAVTFTPFTDTKIGPPKLSLAGCGNCIQMNISLPEADKAAKINERDILKYYGASFKVYWKKPGGSQLSVDVYEKSYTLPNLETGVEYCVQVHTQINTNKNTEPTDWMCTFTSILEPSRVPAVLGAVATSLIISGAVVITLTLFLVYTGFMCKLKAHLPRALLSALVQGSVLTPERTIPDLVSVISEPDGQRKIHNPRMPQPATDGPNSEEEDEEDEDEEEREEKNPYMDREAELSSGTSSCRDSRDTSGASAPTVSGDSGNMSVISSAEEEEEDGRDDRVGVRGERGMVSAAADGDQTGIEGRDVGGMEEEEDSGDSGNVNLFSITLRSLARDEEEEEEEEEEQSTRDSLIDILKLSDREPLLSASLKWDLSSAESQNKIQSDDLTPLALMQPEQTDWGEAGYESRHADTTDTFSGYLVSRVGKTQEKVEEEEEEEEEDEEFSGYMGR
ncbi:cytokine receptor family member b1 [Centroberyx gerrardi]